MIDSAAVHVKPIVLTALAVMVGGPFIIYDPTFQGVAMSLFSWRGHFHRSDLGSDSVVVGCLAAARYRSTESVTQGTCFLLQWRLGLVQAVGPAHLTQFNLTIENIAMFDSPNRLLGVYAGVLTLALAAVLLSGAKSERSTSFETLDVERINLREPDGRLRMVITSSARFPHLIIRGEEYEHPRDQAGMLFFNDEETEQGGLIFSGRKDDDGNVESGVSLTFDRYEQDQQLQLLGYDYHGQAFAGLRVNDRPERSIVEDLNEAEALDAMPDDERAALMEKRQAENYYGAPRYYAGKSANSDSIVRLSDANGTPRLSLMVTPEGEASISFLDDKGEVVRTISAGEEESRN